MIFLIFTNFSAVSDVSTACVGDAACQAGAVLGGGLVAATGWFVWILGTIIFGILMMATRGKLVTRQG